MKKLRWYHKVGIGLIIILNIIIGYKGYNIGFDEGRYHGTIIAQAMFLESLKYHEGWEDAVSIPFIEALMRNIE